MTTVKYEPRSGVAVVRATGELTAAARIPLRATVYKVLAECPAAIIVDLSQVPRASPLAYATLLALAAEAAREPSTPFLLSTPDGEMSRGLALNGPLLRVFPSVADAGRALRTWQLVGGWRSCPLPGTPEAQAEAGCFVADACLDWRLPHLLLPARAVAVDLIEVAHGPRALRLTVSHRPDHPLLVSVRNEPPHQRTPGEPLRREPLGGANRDRLRADGAMACGRLITGAGVTWWASLRARWPRSVPAD